MKKKSVATARFEPKPSKKGFTFESSALDTICAISDVKGIGLFQIYKIYHKKEGKFNI